MRRQIQCNANANANANANDISLTHAFDTLNLESVYAYLEREDVEKFDQLFSKDSVGITRIMNAICEVCE